MYLCWRNTHSQNEALDGEWTRGASKAVGWQEVRMNGNWSGIELKATVLESSMLATTHKLIPITLHGSNWNHPTVATEGYLSYIAVTIAQEQRWQRTTECTEEDDKFPGSSIKRSTRITRQGYQRQYWPLCTVMSLHFGGINQFDYMQFIRLNCVQFDKLIHWLLAKTHDHNFHSPRHRYRMAVAETNPAREWQAL